MPGCPLCGCPGGCAPVDASTWVSLEEYARIHGVDKSTVWRWRRAGWLLAQRIDGKIRVRRLDDRARWPVETGLF